MFRFWGVCCICISLRAFALIWLCSCVGALLRLVFATLLLVCSCYFIVLMRLCVLLGFAVLVFVNRFYLI